MPPRRSGPDSLAALVEAFHCRPSLNGLRVVLAAAGHAGRRAEVRAHLIERLEAGAAADPRLLYRLYLEDGQEAEAALAARRLGEPGPLIEVAEASAPRFRMLALQLYLEAADLLARQGSRPAYARAAGVLSRLRAAMEGEEGRWIVVLQGFRECHRRRRALVQELIRAGLDLGDVPPLAEVP